MNTASLELCKQLYELSRWDKTLLVWAVANEGEHAPWLRPGVGSNSAYTEYSAYDLGYLLRKLPKYTSVYQSANGKWYASGASKALADTPENAACRLTVELFKQGVLKREG